MDNFGNLGMGEEVVLLQVIKLIGHALHLELDDIHHLRLLSNEGRVVVLNNIDEDLERIGEDQMERPNTREQGRQ